jgi:GTP 3',8-cyclase
LRIVRIGVGMGITKVRVTGGEPLVRRGVYPFLRQLSEVPGLSEVTLTTNGVLLADHIEPIRAAGIRRLNISLDSLDRDRYHRITGRDAFDAVWAGIEAADRAGFSPIKLNVVALRGENEDELIDLARLALNRPFHVRFIEHMPLGESGVEETPLLAPEIMERLAPLGDLIPVEADRRDGPAVRYRIPGALGEIGLIRPLSHHFCHLCNRLRLTAAGGLRACLLSDEQLDLRGPMRAGADDETLAGIFLDAVRHKPMRHTLNGPADPHPTDAMRAIGG